MHGRVEQRLEMQQMGLGWGREEETETEVDKGASLYRGWKRCRPWEGKCETPGRLKFTSSYIQTLFSCCNFSDKHLDELHSSKKERERSEIRIIIGVTLSPHS